MKFDRKYFFKYFVISISNLEKRLRKPQVATRYTYRIAGSTAHCAVNTRIPARFFGRNFHQQNYHKIKGKFARKPDKNFI